MNITHVVPIFNSKRKYHEFYLAQLQAQHGHRVTIICSQEKKTDSLRERGDGFDIIRLPRIFHYSDFVLCRGMSAVLRELQPDIVHVHDVTQGFQIASVWAQKKLGYRIVLDQHKYSLTIRPSVLVKLEYLLFRRWIAWFAYRRIDHIIAIVPTAKEFVQRYHLEYKKDFSLIPLGFDSRTYYFDVQRRKKIREQLKISDDDIVVISSGTFQFYKKITDIITAINRLKNTRVHLILVGEISQPDLQSLFLQKSPSSHIHIISHQTDEGLRGYYSASDIAFWNYPTISILSAMACGCIPLVPYDPTTNFYQNAKGFYFERSNIESLIRNLQTLITTGFQNEKKRVVDQVRVFSYHILAEEYEKVYQRFGEQADY